MIAIAEKTISRWNRISGREEKTIEHLEKNAQRTRSFLHNNEERRGVRGKPVKSNDTDNESAQRVNNEDAMNVLQDRTIDGFVADPQFRKRHPRFAEQQEYKAKTTDRKRTSKARKYFTADDQTRSAYVSSFPRLKKALLVSAPSTKRGH